MLVIVIEAAVSAFYIVRCILLACCHVRSAHPEFPPLSMVSSIQVDRHSIVDSLGALTQVVSV